jgi:hypothetical protein
MKALWEFRVVTKRLNRVLELLDPSAALQYQKFRKAATLAYPYLRAFDAVDPSYWLGRVILFNSQTPRHQDSRNPPAEWTPLHAAGDFTEGGSLFMEDLNLRIRYLPGDLIFIRGRLLTHEVEQWEGGQRISAAYFTHESLWTQLGLRLSV